MQPRSFQGRMVTKTSARGADVDLAAYRETGLRAATRESPQASPAFLREWGRHRSILRCVRTKLEGGRGWTEGSGW